MPAALSGGTRLKQLAYLEYVADVLIGETRHSKAARRTDQIPLVCELQQRLPGGHARGPKAIGDIGIDQSGRMADLAQLDAGQQIAMNLVAQVFGLRQTNDIEWS